MLKIARKGHQVNDTGKLASLRLQHTDVAKACHVMLQTHGGESVRILATGSDRFQLANTDLILKKLPPANRTKFIKSIYDSAVSVTDAFRALTKS